MKRTVGYLRSATRMQREESPNLERQRRAIMSAAESVGIAIEEWVSECPASGIGPLPLGLTRILREAEQGEIDQVWIHRPDRLSRRPEALTELLAIFEAVGVELKWPI